MPSQPLSPAEKRRRGAAWLAICAAVCGSAEGIRTVAYRDVGGIPTLCYGETKGVRMGQTATVSECQEWLGDRLVQFGDEVDRCTVGTLPPSRKAAVVDFAYNLGSGAYCRSIAPLLNGGQTAKACDKMLEFNKAAGVVFPGLVTRRKKERDLCMVGLS